MTKLILKKAFYLLLMLFLISLISFFMIHLAPNSFFSAGVLNPNMTPESIEHLKRVYGLDKPLIIQYVLWLKSITLLDFGISFASGLGVMDEIKSRLAITLGMNIAAMVVIFWLALWLGVKSALGSETTSRRIKQLSLLSYSTPSFYLALLFILFLAYKFELFPIGGLNDFEVEAGTPSWYIDRVYHLTLPVSVMIFVGFGSLTLYIRSLTIDILKSDYIYFARSRGFDNDAIRKRYIYPNLLPFIITILGLFLPGLLGGSVILEQIFGIDGMGLLFYQSALGRDYPVIMGILIIGAFLTLLGNIIADLLLYKLNPNFKK